MGHRSILLGVHIRRGGKGDEPSDMFLKLKGTRNQSRQKRPALHLHQAMIPGNNSGSKRFLHKLPLPPRTVAIGSERCHILAATKFTSHYEVRFIAIDRPAFI